MKLSSLYVLTMIVAVRLVSSGFTASSNTLYYKNAYPLICIRITTSNVSYYTLTMSVYFSFFFALAKKMNIYISSTKQMNASVTGMKAIIS